MAFWYVSPGGGDTAAGTLNAPFKTFTKANSRAAEGDEVIALDGLYKLQVSPKSGVNYRSLTPLGAIIDAENTRSYGFLISERNNIVIDGFHIRNANMAGVTIGASTYIHVQNCLVHDCRGNGLSAHRSEFIWFEYNEVHDCAKHDARSGISVLSCEVLTNAPASEFYRVFIRGNKSHGNITYTGSHADGNGIIIDRYDTADDDRQEDNTPNYPYGTLCEYNECYGNGNAGIKLTYTSNALIRRNTCYGNSNDTLKTGTWLSELVVQWGRNSVFEDNIAVATKENTYAVGNYLNAVPDSITWRGNILHHTIAGHAVTHKAASSGNPVGVPEAPANMINVNPRFVNAAAANFALQSNSPAIGAAQDGVHNIGAWQDDEVVEPPVEPVKALTPPVVSASDFTSGKPFTIGGDTYDGTLTSKEYKMQLLDAGGVYRSLAPEDSITPLLFPTVTADTTGRAMALFVADGVTDGRNPSVPFTIKPAVVVDPVDPVDPGDVDSRVTGLETRMGNAETRLDNLTDRVGSLESDNQTVASQLVTLDEKASLLSLNLDLLSSDVGLISGRVTAVEAALTPMTADVAAIKTANVNLSNQVSAFNDTITQFNIVLIGYDNRLTVEEQKSLDFEARIAELEAGFDPGGVDPPTPPVSAPVDQFEFENYKNYILRYLRREGDVDLFEDLNELIQSAEDRLTRDLSTPLITVNGHAVIMSGLSAALPADFRSVIHLVGGPDKQPLLVTSLDNLTRLQKVAHDSGWLGYYAISGRQLRVAGPITPNTVLALDYRRKVPSYQATGVQPFRNEYGFKDLYDAAVLLQTAMYLRDDERLAYWTNIYQELLASANGEAARLEWGSAPLGSMLPDGIV